MTTHCLNPNSYLNKILIERLGEDRAYHVVNLNGGHPMTQTTTGKESILFNSLVDLTGDFDNAVELKTKFYTNGFRNQYGDWINGKMADVDSNGEPNLVNFIDKLGLQVQGKIRGNRVEELAKNDYAATRAYYTPILNRLQEAYKLPWKEDTSLTEPSGYVDGVIKVNFALITPDAPFHEYAHPIIKLLHTASPAAYNRLVSEAMRNQSIVNEVKSKYNSPNVREMQDEILATTLGMYASKANAVMESKGLLAAIRQFFDSIKKVFNHVMGFQKEITVEQLQNMSLREIGFLMGTVTPKMNIGAIQNAYEALEKKGTKRGNQVIVEVPSFLSVEGYRETFGWNNVDIVRTPSAADNVGYKIAITNPIGTNGEILYRKKDNPGKKPSASYKTTNEPFFDDMIRTLHEKVASLRNEKSNKTLNKADRIRYARDEKFYAGVIDDLYRTSTLVSGVGIIASEIDKAAKMEKNEQPITEIVDTLKMLNGFDTIDKYVNDENSTPEVTKTVEKIKYDISRLRNKYASKLHETFKTRVLAEGFSENLADTLFDPIKDINSLDLYTLGSAFAQNSIEQAADFLIRKKAYEGDQQVRQFKTELRRRADAIGHNFAPILKKNDDGSVGIITKMDRSIVDKIADIRKQIKETGKGLQEIRAEIRELDKQLNIAAANADVGRMEELIKEKEDKMQEVRDAQLSGKTWNDYHRFMQQYFNYEFNEERETEYQEFVKDLEPAYYKLDEKGELYFDDKGYKRASEAASPYIFKEYLAGKRKTPNSGGQWFNLTPKDNAPIYSKEYQALNDSQKEFYNFFSEKFMEATSNIFDATNNDDLDMDAAIKDFISMPTELQPHIKWSQAAKDWLKDLVVEREGSDELDIHGVFSGIAQKSIRFKSIQSFLDPAKSLDRQDIMSVLEKYYSAGIAHIHKKNVEDILNVNNEIAYELPKMAKTQKNEYKKDLFGDDKTTPQTSNVYKRVNHIIESYLYGNAKDKLLGNFKAGENVVSGDRIVDMINELTRLRQMGFNPFSGLSNWMMGTINNWSYAKRDEFFNDKNLAKAYLYLRHSTLRSLTFNKVVSGEAEKISLLAGKFNIHDKLLEKQATNKVTEKAYVFQEQGEFLNQMSVVLATLFSEKSFANIVDRQGNKKTMYDVFAVKNGNLILDNEKFDIEALGINDKRMFDIVQGVMKINKEIHGDYDPLNPMYLKRTSMGRAVATFRTWLPQAVYQRVGAIRKDEQLSQMMGYDVFRKGRYRSLGVVSKIGLKNNLKLLGSFTAGFLPFVSGTVNANDRIDATDAANINQTMTELRSLIMIGLGIMAMGKMKDWDDDGEKLKTQAYFNFVYNMSTRMENELSFFYYPSNGYKIFKDVLPMFDTAEQFFKVVTAGTQAVLDPQHDIYKRGYRKGTSRFWKELNTFLPGLKQVESAWSATSMMYTGQAVKK